MRGWARPSKWLPVILTLSALYFLILTIPLISYGISPLHRLPQLTRLKSDYDYKETIQVKKFTFTLNSSRYEQLEIQDVLTNDKTDSFEERMNLKVDKTKPPKIILSYDAGHGPENLGGCPDWNCIFTFDRAKEAEASIILSVSDGFKRRNKNQLTAYYSQESPKNMPARVTPKDFFNVSLGYRHDTDGASPYGYTVKLAKRRGLDQVLNSTRMLGKNKGAAWFVSHCETNSKREDLVEEMKKHTEVDVYGACNGGKSCPRGEKCEDMLDDDYHFYLAFENSICTDYITEKVWNQGYGRDIVPVVLKRSIVENRLPPGSFIAVDDYKTVQELAARMNYLIKNSTAYMEMFNWRQDYATIYLNGQLHDVLERPWGFCQLCRLAWENPKKERSIPDFSQWWDGSCEADGVTVGKILAQSRENKNEKLRSNRT